MKRIDPMSIEIPRWSDTPTSFDSIVYLKKNLKLTKLTIFAWVMNCRTSEFSIRLFEGLIQMKFENLIIFYIVYTYIYIDLESITKNIVPLSSKEFLNIQATIECRLTLKRVRNTIITCRQSVFQFDLIKRYCHAWLKNDVNQYNYPVFRTK